MTESERAGDRNIVLIGGTGRCGTTVLRRMLARHPDVAAVPEWRFMVDPGGVIDFCASSVSTWSPLMFDDRLRRLRFVLESVQEKSAAVRLYRRAIHRLGLSRWGGRGLDVAYGAIDAQRFSPHFGELADRLLRELSVFSYQCQWTGGRLGGTLQTDFAGPEELAAGTARCRDFYLAVVDDVLRHAGAHHFVEKNTWYPLLFERMLEIVPEARLVHISRDPVDVVASLTRQRWSPADPLHAAHYYRSIMRRWHAVRARIPRSSFIEVSYENLCRDAAATLGKVAAFAGLPVPEGPYEVDGRGLGKGRDAFDRETLRHLTDLLADEIAAYGDVEKGTA